jgi:choline dehydrogenase-like flavoprotein
VTLADDADRYGLPVANFSYSRCDNDKALVRAATKVMEEMHKAAGAQEAITIDREAHLIGGCRMADDEADGVVDADLRSFAIANLFIVDGSVCPTQGSANPALTIMALAARAADYLSRSDSVR